MKFVKGFENRKNLEIKNFLSEKNPKIYWRWENWYDFKKEKIEDFKDVKTRLSE